MDNQGRQLIPNPQLEEFSGNEASGASGLEYSADAVLGSSHNARDDPHFKDVSLLDTDNNSTRMDKTLKALDSSAQDVNIVTKATK
ncbi:hypothetical protein OESDEN_15341 [Oesophagostomum dentatum]|uniref:Uncharacterized protein n=1 Tax=Oesophagostomum dentatum TaxID=61180 RepID=A0A0B1SJ40_OESDE|nr:hypothetical protein OESDEN_15341 [Oesophagostomum dentatum]